LFVDIKSNIEPDCDCIACVISSHGAEVPIAKTTENTSYTRHHILFTKDGIIPTDEILELFNDEHCPRLRGKPRMFFIQVYDVFSVVLAIGTELRDSIIRRDTYKLDRKKMFTNTVSSHVPSG
jgi:hypothetical protein